MESNQFTAPQGTISMAVTAPSFSGKTKRSDIQLLPNGPHPAIIYAVVGTGTTMEAFGNEQPKPKNKVWIGLEFPQLKQFFYEEDTEQRSTVMSIDSTFNMGDRSKLRAIAEVVIGRQFKDNTEADNFDVGQLIGAKVLVQVVTKTSKKTGNPYNAIGSIGALGGFPLPANFNPELEYHLFAIDPAGNNFKTINFANLPVWIKKTIFESNEAKAYVAKGGLFAKKNEDTNTGSPQQPQGQQQTSQQQPQGQQQVQQQAAPQAPVQQAPAQTTKKFVMIDTQFTLEQWKAAHWTEESLVAGGKARWEEVTLPPVAPQAPSAPQEPHAPQVPTAPQQAEPQQQQMSFPQGQPQQQQQAQPQAQQPTPAENWLDEDEDDLPF